MSITLFFAAGSCSLVSNAAIERLGLTYKPVRLDLTKGEQRGAGFLAVNPLGRVPALVVDGTAITENIAILTWLDATRPGNLLPADALLRARAYQRASWIASSVQATIAQAFRPERYSDDDAIKEGLRAVAVDKLRISLAELESILADGWIAGPDYCAVDVYSAVIWRWAERLQIDLAVYPAWKSHRDAVMAMPEVQRAIAMETATVIPESAAA